MVTLTTDILASDVARVVASLTSSVLNPIHSTANRAVYHVWDIISIDLGLSDSLLSRVVEWSESPSCHLVSLDRYQNARITATAEIASDEVTFTATNVLPLIADEVS